MSIQRFSLRTPDAPVRNPGLTNNSIAVGEPSPVRKPGLPNSVAIGERVPTRQIGWGRFRDIFVGGSKPRPTGRPKSPQTEPNGRPQKKNFADFLSRMRDLFGSLFNKGLTRFTRMMSMSSSKPLLPPPNTLAGGG